MTSTEHKSSDVSTRLTPGMRLLLGIAGAVVVLGLAIAAWLLLAPQGAPSAETPPVFTSPAPGPVAGAVPTTGSEVPQPDPAATLMPGQIPPRPDQEPLVAAPFPPSADAAGELVAGFPATIAGPVPPSDVLSSSIATEGGTMQLTLVARTDASPDDVRAHYDALWRSLGLAPEAAADPTSTAFADAHTSLTLAFSPASGTGTVYVLYGVFRTD